MNLEKVINPKMQAIPKLKSIDSPFIIAIGLLLLVGLVILQSASGPVSNDKYGYIYYELVTQLIKGVLPGIAIFFLFAHIKFSLFRKFAIFGWIVAIALNIMALFPPFGVTVNGAARWLDIGFFRIQPAEILKLSIILCLAVVFTQLGKKINKGGAVLLVSFIIGLGAIIVVGFQTSLSNGIILLAISLSILFQSKINFRFIGILAIMVAISLGIALSSENFRGIRINTWLNPEQATENERTQIENNLIAVGSGGLTGVGLGESRQKFFYLPEASTDSIFAVFAEETGFIGSVLLINLFIFIIVRMLWLHSKISDEFSRYILIGAVTWIVLQTLLNISTTIQLVPVTGVTLPFISAGGSSTIVLCALFGIIANISKYRQ
ncbi:cell division protein FtsW [bacterium]|nr:cell division protein FtsW [Candidatus Elulimicrobium humile]